MNVASLANNVRATVSGIQMQLLVIPASSQRGKKRKQEKLYTGFKVRRSDKLDPRYLTYATVRAGCAPQGTERLCFHALRI